MFKNDEDVKNYTTQENYKEKNTNQHQSLAPMLPLQYDPDDQYQMIRDYVTLAKQNFKMLLLTSPGERIMDANFGVGLRKYLFELDNEITRTNISRKIENQVLEYMPYIRVTSITFPRNQENTLHIRIKYKIVTLDIEEEIAFAESIL